VATTENVITGSDDLTPRRVVAELDRYIIGQAEAKKVVAIALRNRVRRRRLSEAMRREVHPKNIIMSGPTGVGKTEIARRLARLVGAPFVKVEASKYTEVGYVGRDVESMVRDLVETAINGVREELAAEVRPRAERHARERLLDLLMPGAHGPAAAHRRFLAGTGDAAVAVEDETASGGAETREKLARLLDDGRLEEREIEFEITTRSNIEGMFGVMGGGDEQMMGGLRDMMDKLMPPRKRHTRMKVAEARNVLIDEEIEEMLDKEKLTREGLERAQQDGIIFVDEIDKVVSKGSGGGGPDVSREGVQRDILPIVEGSTVFTKHGTVKTDHILFIAAGAFHSAKVSDLIPELQGRFPLRVELHSLDTDDFKRILVEPTNSLIRQYIELLATDGVELAFGDDAIDEMARAATQVNQQTENIGARRLYSILERVLEEISFGAPDDVQGRIVIDRAYVHQRLHDVLADRDLSRFIL
jgi:ATP-dependent HslUV protease ATP-binding subunit HslU